MRKKQVFLVLLPVVAVVLAQGCKTTIMGLEGERQAVYRLGKLEAVESKDINTVYKATEKALAELELNISQKMKDALSAKIIARDSQDKKITVKLLAITKDTTKVSIRGGGLVKSRLIYQKIQENLD